MRATAYHEAGHAVAALFLGSSAVSISIGEDEVQGTLGHVRRRRPSTAWTQRLKELNYDADFGGMGCRVRRIIERDIMITLAGPVTEARLRGRSNWAGAGLQRLSEAESEALSRERGGEDQARPGARR
ncbi:MAG: hypothetical protein M3Q23_13170 [Actinomycetota bacterium]|nr:hypothetical protein [Actinomycetota bacterium]